MSNTESYQEALKAMALKSAKSLLNALKDIDDQGFVNRIVFAVEQGTEYLPNVMMKPVFDTDNMTFDDELEYIKTITELNARCLHELIGDECKKNVEFRCEHTNKCHTDEFIYVLRRTRIGEAITVQCPVCGELKNITDVSRW